MKKIIKTVLLALILVTLAFSACTGNGQSNSNSSSSPNDYSSDFPLDNVEVNCILTDFEVEDIYLNEYDFTKCFEIFVNGEAVEVKAEYLDLSALKAQAGTYTISCEYSTQSNGDSAQALVTVITNDYQLTLEKEQVTVKKAYALDFDYLALFSASKNGEAVEIEQSMIDTNFSSEPGVYYFTVNYANQSKTLTITITNEHEVEVHVTYANREIAVSELSNFDYTTLFSLFVDGVATQVTADTLDISSISEAVVGDILKIRLNYSKDDTSVSATATVTVVEDAKLIISAKNIQTYPNSGAIDLTTLFTITKGDEQIEVTSDMIDGVIDYSKAGINVITLNYQGEVVTATVEVVIGVVISYATADTIIIKKDTDQTSYAFEKDFIVNINGVRFTVLSDYIDTSAVDFSTVGSYQVTLRIPYNEQKLGLTSVKFDYYEKTITYQVVANEYKISLKQEVVELVKGTQSYNPFKNVSLSINGINQSLTDRPDYVDRITCYAKVISNPIDFAFPGMQEVTVEVYVNGTSSAPVTLSFFVIIQTDVELVANDGVIFTGETLYPTQLFTATNAGEQVEVTLDMITGKIDSFTPGVYYVTATYEGVQATAKVVVLNNAIKGEYKTNLYQISATNSDYDEEYGDTAPAKKRVGSMRITQDGKIFIKNVEAQLVNAVDQNTLIINYRSNLHTVYYNDGIITIVPENNIKLQYYEEKRPYIYFNTDIWTINQKFIINSASSYVLDASTVAYSFDVFKLTNKVTGENLTYALKIHLASRLGSDTVYLVSWGEVEFAEGFKGQTGESSSLTFDCETYNFVMETAETGKVPSANNTERPLAGMTFRGTINGESATLVANVYQAFTLTVGTTKVFTANYYEIESMDNGGVNTAINQVFLYKGDKRNNEYYSYKFIIDMENKTFELVERDNLLGFYETENGYIFLDGYGTGFINFNAQSYYETDFEYGVLNNMLTVKYLRELPDFKYGTGAQFIIDAFGNVLTVHSGTGLTVGQTYENTFIQSGIIVKVNIETIGGGKADSVAKAELYRAIEIIDKNGKLSPDANGVGTYIDTSRVRWSVPGFYRLTVTAELYGKQVTAYYAIQVLQSIYAEEPMIGNFGAGVIYPENSLIIDEYGRVMLSVGSVLYNGSLKIGQNGAFSSELYGQNGVVNLSGKVINPGLIQIRASGAVGYLDYYTVGSAYVIGKDNVVLRAFKFSDSTTYILASAITSATGEVVEVECINGKEILSTGAVIKIIHSKGVTHAKTQEWNNGKNGLLLSDAYLGSYVGNGEQLTIDGFGKATYGTSAGTYVINGTNKITVYIDDVPCAYQLNVETGEYTVMDIKFDNSLIEGKTYFADYNFICNNYLYSATTTFAFLANGKVKITSKSTEHDSGEDRCTMDSYSPVFCPDGSIVGTYSVVGTKITVTANGYTITFNILNAVYPNEISCLSTTVSSEAHGYFKETTVFSREGA